MNNNEQKRDNILPQIERLQVTRNYADKVESIKLTEKIRQLLELLDA